MSTPSAPMKKKAKQSLEDRTNLALVATLMDDHLRERNHRLCLTLGEQNRTLAYYKESLRREREYAERLQQRVEEMDRTLDNFAVELRRLTVKNLRLEEQLLDCTCRPTSPESEESPRNVARRLGFDSDSN